MSIHMAKAALRQAKNITKGFTDIQIKVREATSNDPWGPSGSQMAEIADATFDAQDFMEIMDMVDKRLNDSGKNWRHVFKALTLLDYLIHSGSEQVVAYAKQNLYVIKTLKEFQFIDDDGRDQGLNVREKSKAIAALLSDEERLKEERKSRAALRERMHVGGGMGGSSRRETRGGADMPVTPIEERRDLERAIEESKRTAAEHERRLKEREREEKQLQRAIEQTRKEQQQQQPQSSSSSSQQQQQQQNQLVDLWGSHPTDQRKQDLDFFSSMAAPAPAASSQPDPFGFSNVPAPSQNNNSNFFAVQQQQQQIGFASSTAAANPFGGQPNAFAASAFAPAMGGGFAQPGNAFAASTPAFGQPTAPVMTSPPMGQATLFAGATSAPANTNNNNAFQPSFDSAFDTGAGQKSLVPRHLQGQANPNAQLAQIARNASQIDPFANLANQGSAPAAGGNAMMMKPLNPTKSSMNDSFGGSNAPSGASANAWSSAAPSVPNYTGNFGSMSANNSNSNPFGSKPAASNQPDPFASLAPLAKPSAAPSSSNAMVVAGGKPMNAQSSFTTRPSFSGMTGSGNFGFASSAPVNPFGGAPSMMGAGAGGMQQPPLARTGMPAGSQNNLFGQAPVQQMQPPQQQPSQNNFFF